VLDRYHGDLVAIATEAMVAGPVARWAEARAEAVGGRSAVYRYRVDFPGAGEQLRATHTVEVPLLFGTWTDGGPGERLGGQADNAGAVSGELTAAWGRFVHGESPGWAREGVNESPTNSDGLTLDTRSETVYSFPRWAQVSAFEGET